MKRILRYLLPAALLIGGCSTSGTEPAQGVRPDAFFDLKGFIKEEAQRLSEQQPRVRKRIEVSGKQEVQTFDSLDYSKELDIFSRSDINRVAWLDKYQVDSTFERGQLAKITYTTDDEELKTHRMEIEFDQGKASSIYVRNKTESIVANIEQEMQYRTGEGYWLVSSQSTELSGEKEVKVEAEFLE